MTTVTRITLPVLLDLSNKCISNAYTFILNHTTDRQQGELQKWVTDISGAPVYYYDRHKMPKIFKILAIYKFAQCAAQGEYLANIRVTKHDIALLRNNLNLVQ